MSQGEGGWALSAVIQCRTNRRLWIAPYSSGWSGDVRTVRAGPITLRLLRSQHPVGSFPGNFEIHSIAQHLVGIQEEHAGPGRPLAAVRDADHVARVKQRAIAGPP